MSSRDAELERLSAEAAQSGRLQKSFEDLKKTLRDTKAKMEDELARRRLEIAKRDEVIARVAMGLAQEDMTGIEVALG